MNRPDSFLATGDPIPGRDCHSFFENALTSNEDSNNQ